MSQEQQARYAELVGELAGLMVAAYGLEEATSDDRAAILVDDLHGLMESV